MCMHVCVCADVCACMCLRVLVPVCVCVCVCVCLCVWCFSDCRKRERDTQSLTLVCFITESLFYAEATILTATPALMAERKESNDLRLRLNAGIFYYFASSFFFLRSR